MMAGRGTRGTEKETGRTSGKGGGFASGARAPIGRRTWEVHREGQTDQFGVFSFGKFSNQNQRVHERMLW